MRTVITLDTDVRPWDPPPERGAGRRKRRGGGGSVLPLLFFVLVCIGGSVFAVIAFAPETGLRVSDGLEEGLPPDVKSEAGGADDGNPSAPPAGMVGFVAVVYGTQLTFTPCPGAYTLYDSDGTALDSGLDTASAPVHVVNVPAGVVCDE